MPETLGESVMTMTAGLSTKAVAGAMHSEEIKMLDRVLLLIPTTLEMGLSPYHSYPLQSEASLDQAVADLNAARDSDERYSGVRFMSLAALKPLVTKLLWSGKANNLTYEVRRLLRFTVSENTIILWHELKVPVR
jgi:hypothetical protein